MHENRATSTVPELKFDTGRTVKAISHKTVVYTGEESDPGILCAEQHVVQEG
jgi:hypothetical protein